MLWNLRVFLGPGRLRFVQSADDETKHAAIMFVRRNHYLTTWTRRAACHSITQHGLALTASHDAVFCFVPTPCQSLPHPAMLFSGFIYELQFATLPSVLFHHIAIAKQLGVNIGWNSGAGTSVVGHRELSNMHEFRRGGDRRKCLWSSTSMVGRSHLRSATSGQLNFPRTKTDSMDQ